MKETEKKQREGEREQGSLLLLVQTESDRSIKTLKPDRDITAKEIMIL